MERIRMQLSGEARPLSMARDFSAPPEDLGASTWWSGPPVEVHCMEPWEGDAEIGPLAGEHGILVYTKGAADIHTTFHGSDAVRTVTAGTLRTMSGDDDRPRFRRIVGHAEVLVVHLPTPWITRALGEDGVRAFARTTTLAEDATLSSLACEMLAEVNRRGSTGPLFAESLALAFVSYAGVRLGVAPGRGLPETVGFSPPERERLRQFITSRLRDDLTLTELAAVVGLRPRHFSARFNRAFGCSPYRFVLNRRLSEAARLLATTQLDVAEVAYEMGFCSQSHFTALFRKTYGVTPGQYVTGRRASVS